MKRIWSPIATHVIWSPIITKFDDDQPRDYHGRFGDTSEVQAPPPDGTTPKHWSEMKSGDHIVWGKHGVCQIQSIGDNPKQPKYKEVTAKNIVTGKNVKFYISLKTLYPIVNDGVDPKTIGAVPTGDEKEKEKEKPQAQQVAQTATSVEDLQKMFEDALTRFQSAREIADNVKVNRFAQGKKGFNDNIKMLMPYFSALTSACVDYGAQIDGVIQKNVNERLAETGLKPEQMSFVTDVEIMNQVGELKQKLMTDGLEIAASTAAAGLEDLLKDRMPAGTNYVKLAQLLTGADTGECFTGRYLKVSAAHPEGKDYGPIFLARLTQYVTEGASQLGVGGGPLEPLLNALNITGPINEASAQDRAMFERLHDILSNADKELTQRYNAYTSDRNFIRDTQDTVRKTYAEESHKILSQLRPMLSIKDVTPVFVNDYKAKHMPRLESEFLTALEKALPYIPKDFMPESTDAKGVIGRFIKACLREGGKGTRSYARESNITIFVKTERKLGQLESTILHELTHQTDFKTDTARCAEAFWYTRCPKARTSQNVGGNRGDADTFPEPYSGTYYGVPSITMLQENSWEITTIGQEALAGFNERRLKTLADEEYRRYMLGVLMLAGRIKK